MRQDQIFMFGHHSGGRVEDKMKKRGWNRQTVYLSEDNSIWDYRRGPEDLEVEVGIESQAERETVFQLQVDTGNFLLLIVPNQCISNTWELLEMQILRSYPRYTVSQNLVGGSHKSNFE